MHPTARQFVFTGAKLDTIIEFKVEEPEDVSITFELIDETVAIANIETENDLPEGDFVIFALSQKGDFNYSVTARVAVVTNFIVGAFLIGPTVPC